MMDGKFEATLKEMKRRTQTQCLGGVAQSLDVHAFWRRCGCGEALGRKARHPVMLYGRAFPAWIFLVES